MSLLPSSCSCPPSSLYTYSLCLWLSFSQRALTVPVVHLHGSHISQQMGKCWKNKDIMSKSSDEELVKVVLKIDLHCLGCARRIKAAIQSYHGVDLVKKGKDNNNVIVVGVGIDPAKLKDVLEKKMRRKVKVISQKPLPEPKADDNNGNLQRPGGGMMQEAADSNYNNNRNCSALCSYLSLLDDESTNNACSIL